MISKGLSLRFIVLALAMILLAAFQGRAVAQAASEVYRIVILSDQTQEKAQEGKRLMESWGFSPVTIQERAGRYSVLYGSFQSKPAAAQVMQSLKNDGVLAQGVVAESAASPAAAATAAAPSEVYSVYLRDFTTIPQAEAEKVRLQGAGYSPVYIRQEGRFIQIYVGNYSLSEATVAFGQLRRDYPLAYVEKLPPAASVAAPAAPAAPAPAAIAATPAAPAPEVVPVPQITQSEEWKKLSEEEKRKVIVSELMQHEVRQGNPLAQQMVDINKRLENLDSYVKSEFDKIQKENAQREAARQEINQLYQNAENFIRSEKYNDAIVILKSILDKDKDNQFNQRAVVTRRIEMLQSRIQGESFEGESKVKDAKYKSLQEQAEVLTRSSSPREWERAIGIWEQIRQLDPNKFGPQASAQIELLNQQVNKMQDLEQKSREAKQQQMLFAIIGLVGAFVILGLMLIVVAIRSRRQHRDLVRRVQEITSIRPMRELEGGGPSLLAGASSTATESDIFSPRLTDGNAQPGDPLGGIAEAPEPTPAEAKSSRFAKFKKKGKGKAEPEPEKPAEASPMDDIFGEGPASAGASGQPAPAVMSMGDDMGLDDIFGASEPAPAKAAAAETTQRMEAEPTMGQAAAESDDIFSNLFADEPTQSTVSEAVPAMSGASAKPAAPAKAEADFGPPGAHDTGPISFDDMIAVGSGKSATGPVVDESELLSVFEGPADGPNGGSAGKADLQDSPFASMFENLAPESSMVGGASTNPAREDDTEIPSIKLDMSAGPGSTSAVPLGDITAGSTEIPAISFDDFEPFESAPDAVQTLGGVATRTGGIELDFESDTVGQTPAGWEGSYPFAQLAVAGDTPPKGSRQYLSFVKSEGSGKALFSLRFEQIGGTVGIEFDLRCNDKNKFLLGFYIEKDGDFQQSIHTKILRSEAQTTPTIHMQGESAPYLLGSWAHIKYVVDLKAQKLNGYIDSTHVVRDLPLQMSIPYLNTLSIRDNINTTGVLLLDNIKVYPMP